MAVGWAFVFMMVGLKIPLIALLWLVWWAARAEPDDDEGGGGSDPGDDDGPRHPRPRPRRPSRRGPHGDHGSVAPRRTRIRVPARPGLPARH
ncbi:MAG: hypothetical protein WKF33_04460 [Thermoleophilaceae bacterium]